MTVLTLTGLVIFPLGFSINRFFILLDMNSDQTLHSRQFAKIIGKQGFFNDAQVHNVNIKETYLGKFRNKIGKI